MTFYVYMLECADKSLYTGYTDDLVKRLAVHNAGEGAKYTRSRRQCSLVYVETFDSKHDALSREWHIKHTVSREDKLKLVENNKNLLQK
jgi:putative endonuclease